MSYVHDDVLGKIETLKQQWKLDEALKIANEILIKNPKNSDALLQVADIEYLKWDLWKAQKPVDFLLNYRQNDPIGYYVKWVLEMEKTNWSWAKANLRKALELVNFENPEMLRCYALSEYWSWNREKGIDFLEKAYDLNDLDAEIIYNIIEINLLEKRYNISRNFIEIFNNKHSKLETFWKDISYYDDKIKLFIDYLDNIK